MKLLVLMTSMALLLAILYLSLRGFPDAAVRGVERRLRTGSFVVRIGAIKLNIFEGLTAMNVRCYRRGDIGRPIIEVERLILGLRPVRHMMHETGLLDVSIRKGSVRIAIGDATREDKALSPQAITMNNVHAVLGYESKTRTLRVDAFSLSFMGLAVSGRGSVVLPDQGKEAASSDRVPDAAMASLNGLSVYDQLKKFEWVFVENVIHMDLDFFVDLQDAGNNSFDVNIESRSEAVTLASHSRTGTCVSRATYRGGKGIGMIVAHDHLFSGVWLQEAMGEFDFDGRTVSLRRLDGVLGRGKEKGPFSISGEYDHETGCCTGTVSFQFDPCAVIAPLEARGSHGASVINDFVFGGGPPGCDAGFHGVVRPEWRMLLNGKAHAEDFSYRDVSIVSANTDLALDLSATNRIMRLDGLGVKIGEGVANACLGFDFLSQTVSFEGVSDAAPSEIAKMIGPFMTNLIGRFRIEDQLKVEASGIAGYADQSKNDIKVSVEGRKFGWNRFLCDEGSLRVHVLDDKVTVNEIEGSAYGGTFGADVDLDLAQDAASNMKYKLNARVGDMDFGLAMTAVSGGATNLYRGACSASVELQGTAGEGQGKTAKGKGEILVANGHLFQVPLFGELSSFVIAYVPGFSLLLRQTDAKASVVIGDGFVSSDSILVEGDVFSLEGRGRCSLAGDLDFDAQFVLFRQHTFVGGMMRYLMLPVSKMLEFSLDGTIKEPRWRPVYLPKELFFMFGRDDEDL